MAHYYIGHRTKTCVTSVFIEAKICFFKAKYLMNHWTDFNKTKMIGYTICYIYNQVTFGVNLLLDGCHIESTLASTKII